MFKPSWTVIKTVHIGYLAIMTHRHIRGQCSELHVRQTDPTVCRRTEVLKTLLDPTDGTEVWPGTDAVRPRSARNNYQIRKMAILWC